MSEDEEEGRTVFVPGTAVPPARSFTPPVPASVPESEAVAEPAPGGPIALPVTATTFTAAAIRADARLQPGEMLNDIFEVRRYITAGGMGEVWEGVNTHTDERVAIKVILPHLAADPNVQAMFRKEARTLTRLSHPALVGYRVLAIEPRLGILYIVTEFIDGTMLEQSYRYVPRDATALKGFSRRLAEGLRAAHDMGLVHRDMSPDNVMLEDGQLARARIIDFGIAKDLDTHKGTIIGDGFAGKIGYVAPEQLGDFGREVGPWTDVYSLGLVILAVAAGKSPDMGATLVDAVDKRRAGVDLTAAPESLRLALAAMLEPDPERRLRDMNAVIAALDGVIAVPATAAPMPRVVKGAFGKGDTKGVIRAPISGMVAFVGQRGLLLTACAAIALLVLAGGAFWLFGGDGRPTSPTTAVAIAPARASKAAAAPADAVATASSAISRALPTISCSWLDVADLRRDGDGVSLTLGGVAGDPVAAQGALQRALGDSVKVRDIKADVMTLPRDMCGAVETYSKIRETGPPMLSIEKHRWELDRQADGKFGDDKVVRVPFFIDPRVSNDNFTTMSMDNTGVGTYVDPRAPNVVKERKEILANYRLEADGRMVSRVPNDNNITGVQGIALLRGAGPYDASLLVQSQLPAASEWSERFLKAATAKGWKIEIVWFQTQDLTPN